jgi:branched-chain amino acid aminotransferase
LIERARAHTERPMTNPSNTSNTSSASSASSTSSTSSQPKIPDAVPAEYHVPFAWLDGKVVEAAASSISLMAYTLHYGLGVFEGIRAYDGARGPAVFRLREHMDRLHRSAKMVRMEVPFSVDELVAGACDVLAANKLRAGYIRPIAFVDDGKRGLGAMNNAVRVGIAVWPWGAYLGDEGIKRGIRCQIANVARMSPRSFLPKGKICGQYVNSIIAKRAALLSGYDEAILLDDQGYVAEASGENIFCIKDGRLTTPAPSSPILEGITRDSIIKLARHLGYEVKEQRFARDALLIADEIFLTGTAAEVTPVRDVDGISIGSGSRGPIVERIQSTYRDAVLGKLPGFESWLTPYSL